MIYAKIFIVLLAVMQKTSANFDEYCSGLCDRRYRHIACGHSGGFGQACRKPQLVNIGPLQKTIIHLHNNLRNNIAQGYDRFPPAARMATMSWDPELAKLAEFNVKQCEMRHDNCRNTKRFRYAGQNLAMQMWYNMNFTDHELIEGMILGWYNEYKDCPVEVTKNFRFLNNGKVCGHFTALIQEKSTHVGCAFLRDHVNGFDAAYLACNYAMTNILGQPVYSHGRTASSCKTGTNSQYTSLCSVKETYND